jgi:hypothetical protein
LKFSQMCFHMQEGDIITSKKGILLVSPLTNESYLVKKIKINGDNAFEVMGNKEKIDVRPIAKAKVE